MIPIQWGVTKIDEEDQTSTPHWSIKGKYQIQNQQGEWHNAAQERAIRIELRGSPRSAFTQLRKRTATPADGQVTVDWIIWIPTTQDVIQTIQYRVKQVGEPWSPDWTDIRGSDETTETHTIGNLTNGVEHTIELRAVFAKEGQTLYGGAETIRTTPRAPLTAPRNLDASTEGDGGVRLSWSDPADSTLTGYQYRHQNTSDDGWDPDWTNIPGSGATTTSHTLTGMAKNLSHTLEVRMLRGTEQGPAASSSVTPRGTLPHLRGLTAAADDQQATLSWNNPGDHGITGYQYRHQAATETVWNPTGRTSQAATPAPRPTRCSPWSISRPTPLTYAPCAASRKVRPQGTAATTPDGPAAVPKEPRNLVTREKDQGFTASWETPPDEDERAP